MVALRIVRSPVGAVLRAIRENPLRAAAVGHNIHGYKLTAFVIAAAYAGLAGGLLGVMQAFMPPDAFMFETSGQLVMQTAIGGRGTLFGPLVGAAVWLFLQDFLQATLNLGATWKLVLGLVFVLLVCFLRQGIIGGAARPLRARSRGKRAAAEPKRSRQSATPSASRGRAPMPARHASCRHGHSGPDPAGERPHQALRRRRRRTTASTSRVERGELRGIIGPNGAGKTHVLQDAHLRGAADAPGKIVFEGRDITGMSVTDVCQLGLTKSYQVNQLFNRLTVRENVTIAALAALRGKFRLDLLRSLRRMPRARRAGRAHARARRPRRPARHAGRRARLWREAPAGDRPRARLLAEPAAARRAARRHEPARARARPCELLKSIGKGRTMIVIDHDIDSLFELAERVTVLQEGRVLVEGTPDEIKRNAAVQEAYLGGVNGGAALHEPARSRAG